MIVAAIEGIPLMSTANSAKAATDPTSDIDQLKEDIRAIRDDFTSLASTTGKVASRKLAKQAARAKEFSEDVAEHAGTYRDVVVQKVKDHPLAAVGVAALAGLVIASLSRR
jgi:ElaB/YqjD/DUF883 family membrane-anchored ribosome-binding protein